MNHNPVNQISIISTQNWYIAMSSQFSCSVFKIFYYRILFSNLVKIPVFWPDTIKLKVENNKINKIDSSIAMPVLDHFDEMVKARGARFVLLFTLFRGTVVTLGPRSPAVPTGASKPLVVTCQMSPYPLTLSNLYTTPTPSGK